MVKSLNDILKEIENQKPIVRNFANGGYDDDMGHDEDQGFSGPEGAVTESDAQPFVDAGVMTSEEVASFVDEANKGQGRVDQQFDILDAARRQQGTDEKPVASLERGIDYLDSIYDPARSLWGMVPKTKEEAGIGLAKTAVTSALGIPALLSIPAALAYNAYARAKEKEEFEESLAKQGIKGTWTNQAPVDFDYTRNYNDPNDMGMGEGYEPKKFTTQVAQQLTGSDDSVVTDTLDEPVGVYENLVANLVQNRPSYTGAKSGGSIDAFSPGGLAEMMRRRQQLSPNPFQPYPHSEPRRPRRASDSNQGGMFGGFPRLGDQGSKDTQLNSETYFHEHEGGKVNYPNFPSQTSIEPATKRNPFKSVMPKTFPQPTPKQYVSENLPSVTQEIATPLETPVAAEEEAVEQQVTQPTSINIDMPQNVTATLDFPEDVVGTPQYNYKGGNVMRYNQGGLTGLASNNPEQYNLGGFLRGMIPALAGGAAMFTPLAGLGMNPWLVGGLSGAATGALTGGKQGRTVLGAAKNFLMGSSGASAIGTTAGVGQAGAGTVKGSLPAYEKAIKAGTFKADPVNWANVKSGVQGLMDAGIGDSLKALTGPLSGLGASMALTPPPTGGSPMTPQQVAQMSPEQQEKFLQTQRERFPYQRPTFQPPNTGINFAADGGVMEIDEEMESGSFVLPADVVSNVGDGSSTSGHRRLAQLFGGGDDYAIGGGILKGPIKGPGGGLDDLIQTGIDGVRVARLSTDEFVVPKDVVRKIGDGSQKAGAEQLYDFMKNVRLNKHGTSQQPKGINMAGLKKMV